MTLAEFLAFEGEPDTRYELVHGEIWAMAPVLRAHSRITVNLASALTRGLRPPCVADAGIGIAITDTADSCFIPDLIVSCGPVARDKRLIDNPRLIVEILSPSTEQYDRGLKLGAYQKIPSVEAILLVSTTEVRVERWLRQGESWLLTPYTANTTFDIAPLALTLSTTDIYDGIDFSA